MFKSIFALALACLPSLATAQQTVLAPGQQLFINSPQWVYCSTSQQTGFATGLYSCDSTASLHISIISPMGTEQTANVYRGDVAACARYAAELAKSRKFFQFTSLLGVCDSSATLHRFSVTPQGSLQELSKVYVGAYDACEKQASAINL